MRDNIIVEGCDGSGKDTLIAQLTKLDPTLVQHSRASTSLGGPVPNLERWVEDTTFNLALADDRFIFNRHPLYSEPIYGPRRTLNPGAQFPFENAQWLHGMRTVLGKYCTLVICQPPIEVLAENIHRSSDGHLPGVVSHWPDIYADYCQIIAPAGRTIRYDYTRDTPEDLIKSINALGE